MAKRVLLGKPADDDYGLYVSKSGSDVIDGSGNLTTDTNLMFDSRVGVGALNLKFHGEGLLGIPGNNLNSANLRTVASDTSATITHNLGFTPFVIVQWCLQSDLSGGVATKMYPATQDFNSQVQRVIGSNYTTRRARGGVSYAVTSSTLTITNNFIGQTIDSGFVGYSNSRTTSGGASIAYAFLIFDTTGA